MTAIIRMHALLPTIQRLDFFSSSGSGSQCGWSGQGRGTVEAMRHDDGSLTFTEAGHFQLDSPETVVPRPVPFRNRFRWIPTEAAWSLSHERRGRDAAVWLFDLVETAEEDADLVSRSAHLCVDDLYQARLTFTAGGFDLEWTITGPKKNERLYYRYRDSAVG